jgi:hypothetical protein
LSRYFQTGVALTATQTMNFTVGKGAKVSGVVTLPSVPAGGTFRTGSVAFIDRTTYQTYVATGTMTAADSFSYQVSLPAGSYRVMTTFSLGFGSGAAMSILTRRRFDKNVEICRDADYNVVLDPIGAVTTRATTVTGLSVLGPARSTTGYIGFVTMENDSQTLSCFAASASTSGDSFQVMMALPDDTFIPLVRMTDAGFSGSPRQSGLTSGVKLAPVPAAPSYTLPLVPVVKMSGTVTDPMLQMVQPVPLAPIPNSPTGPSPVSYLHCDSTDLGTFPDPPLIYNDGATGNIFSDAASYRTFIRKGMECSLYAVLAIQLGAGGAPTNQGENTYGFLELPAKNRERMVASADFTKDYAVTKAPANIQISGTITDADGATLGGAGIDFHGTSLQGAGYDTYGLTLTVVADAQGHFKANLLPGTYDIGIQK